MIGWEKRRAGFGRRQKTDRRTACRCAGRAVAEQFGIGAIIHVGETVLGIKGRVGFEAGAALVLISAHRELEKLVQTKVARTLKDHLGRFYGDQLHGTVLTRAARH